MLVTLGSNATIGAGASQTFQYACNSFQKLYVSIEDTNDSLDAHVTVQIGNDVICNDISSYALSHLSYVTSGGKTGATSNIFVVDFGSHVLEPLENLYVTIRNSDASASMDALDISAIVNEGGIYEPLKLTNYSDSVFTDSNTLAIYAWADASLKSDATAFTVRNQAYSATPQVQSGVSVSETMVQGSLGNANMIGVMAKNQVPLDTSVNYSSTAIDGVICISAMPKMPSKAQASGQAGRAVLASMTSSERKAL